MSHKKKTKLRKEIRTVLILVTLILIVVCATLLYRSLNSFSYETSLDDTVVTISGNEIKLREVSYYVMKVERAGNEAAVIYDEKNPVSYWSLYMNDEFKRSGYVSELAKLSAMDNCIRDNIYYEEALNHKYDLDDEVKKELIYDADQLYYHMSTRERNTLGISMEDMERIVLKEAIAHDYILYLCGLYGDGVIDGNVVITNAMTLYDINGSYYEQLKSDYNVIINEKLWNKVRVGFVTIN